MTKYGTLIVIFLLGFCGTAHADGLLIHTFDEPGAGQGGWSLAGAGDLNGDGYDDVIVGRPEEDVDGKIDAGAAYVYSGRTREVIHHFEGEDAGDKFGKSVDSLRGDVDGDGVDDIVIGTWKARRVYIYSGAPGSDVPWAIRRDPYPFIHQSSFGFGSSVAGVEDMDDDGLPDFIVGDLGHAHVDPGTGEIYRGAAFIFSSDKPSGLPSWKEWYGALDPDASDLGESVAALGDLNDDGYSEILVGDPQMHGNGGVYLYDGETGNPRYTFEGPAPHSFGCSVDSLGDVNGDTIPDLIIGAYGQGRAYVFSGDADAGYEQLALFGSGGGWPPHVGGSVSGVGDFDGDGVWDAAVGADGTAWVFSGADFPAITKLLEVFVGLEHHAIRVGEAGDVTGDGIDDVLVSNYSRDKTYVYTYADPCIDDDGDGYGVSSSPLCAHPEIDCDDTDPATYPGAADPCDGVDQGCDGLSDEIDTDGDGHMICAGDCDDSDPAINPGAVEICDGVDNNCTDGIDEEPAASASCEDELFCNGPESCDEGLHLCVSSGDPCSGDGLFCTGDESCDEDLDQCVSSGDPCVDGSVCTDDICDEGLDECDNPCIATGPSDPCCTTEPACVDDPVCVVEFTLDLDASYTSGSLVLNYTIGTPESATWSNYLILTSPTIQVFPLWTVPLPVIDPPFDIPISFPFPSLGWVGIYTGLFTAEGPQAVELVWVNTG